MKDVDSGELAASISHQSSLLKRIFLSQAGISHFSGGYIFFACLVLFIGQGRHPIA